MSAPVARTPQTPAYEPVPEHTPAYTLDRFIAETRREMGEHRWAALNKEWDA